MFYVRNGTTIPIGAGQTFPTLAIAWKYVHNARVATDAYLHLSIVTSGGSLSESFSAPLNLDMVNGSQVSMIGDNFSDIQLAFPSSSGLTIDSDHSFGTVSGISLNGGNGHQGIYSGTGGAILNISNIGINGFNYQMYAESRGSLVCGTGLQLLNCYNYGCYADNGSIIIAYQGLNFSGSPGDGVGLVATHNGFIDCEGSSIANDDQCVVASYGGTIDVSYSAISHSNIGCEATYGGTITAIESSFANNFQYDIEASYNGVVNALSVQNVVVSANTGGQIGLN